MEPSRQIGPRQVSPRPAVSKGKAVAPDDTTETQHQAFDFEMAERAELLREAGVRRDMMLAQLKADDEALKKYIAMI
jgi:hypothetical protein